MKLALVYNFHSQQGLPAYSYFDTGISKKLAKQKITVADDIEWASLHELLTKLEANTSLKVNVNFSGRFLSQLKNNKVELERVRGLIEKDRIEIIGSPYYNSLSCLLSKELFEFEIKKQTNLLEQILSVKASGFMNSALLFSNPLASILQNQGFTYTLVPKIEWFIPRSSNEKVFRSTNSEIKLVLAQFTPTEEEDFNVIIVDSSELLSKEGKSSWTNDGFALSDQIINNTNEEIYSLPDLVAEYKEGETLELLLGNNLQKDLLSRLKELSATLTSEKDDELMEKLLWIGSAYHFQLISNKIDSVKRYNNYTILQNFLYDFDLQLRAG